ncbi:MAG: hypothetical protein JOY57_00780, partial [Actinobacteria bacterium]|nr:hypothetical protein [Actinomycetota bacterium]
MLKARRGVRAAVVSGALASMLAGATAVALPMLPSSHTAASHVVAAGDDATTSNANNGEGAYDPTGGVTVPVADTSGADATATTVASATPATRPVAAVKTATPKPTAPKPAAKAKPKSSAGGVNVAIPTGPLVGKLNTADIEGYARYEPQSTCDPTDKPGAVALKTLLTGYYKGTSSFGISRACGSDRSEHYEGRAFDWGVNVNNASQKAAADNFIAQLMATDSFGHKQALARRMGIMYVIWNHQIWSPGPDSTWRPYTGSNPHTDHVHISLSWAGARAETSYWSGTVVPGLPGDDQFRGGSGSGGTSGGHQWDSSAGDHWSGPTPTTTPTTAPSTSTSTTVPHRRHEYPAPTSTTVARSTTTTAPLQQAT